MCFKSILIRYVAIIDAKLYIITIRHFGLHIVDNVFVYIKSNEIPF